MSGARVKICGLSRRADVDAAARTGAAYVGFVSFTASLRHVTIERMRALALKVPPGVIKVALTVNADNAMLGALTGAVPLDMLQLHGGEPPDRVIEVRARYRLPVMKAVGVADETDLIALEDYEQVADMVLVDAKPPEFATLPGGNGLAFDWRLLQGREWRCPWMLAGGLTPENVGTAVRLTGAQQVDVSTGVERAPGMKDAGLIEAFIAAAGATGAGETTAR